MSPGIELGRWVMDELTRRNNQATDRLIASLTPQQRALAKVGALRADQLTPYQQSLAAEIKVPEGMTAAQAREYGRLSTLEENRERFQEGFQRGWEDADKQANKLKWMGLGIGCCIAILIVLARC
jgi:flagellar biosynthesis/type III secretory pathway protein FliH